MEARRQRPQAAMLRLQREPALGRETLEIHAAGRLQVQAAGPWAQVHRRRRVLYSRHGALVVTAGDGPDGLASTWQILRLRWRTQAQSVNTKADDRSIACSIACSIALVGLGLPSWLPTWLLNWLPG